MPDRLFESIPARALPATLLAAITACVLLGCLPEPRERVAAAPVIVETETAGQAFWRAKYRKNRMEPPEQLSVPAKMRPDNSFGEFSDAWYRGLDPQPELPPLPGESRRNGAGEGRHLPMAMMPPGGRGESSPASGGTGEQATWPPQAPATAVAGPGPQSQRLQPIEQLIYGGSHGDMDKPDGYRLMPGDTITISVRDHPEFAGPLTLQADGTVNLPNTPDMVRLRGLTVDEAAEKIRLTLAVYIRGETVVRVQTNRARGGHYFVHGDVLQPGRFPMGMEPVRLSDAVLAANWEAKPGRSAGGDEELGPAFPAATPRGRYAAPVSADLARVMLITPHRTRPARTVHDIRSAMLGVTGNDPVVRPGQIVVVPSLDPERNRLLGLTDSLPSVAPEAVRTGAGFSGAEAGPRLPDVLPPRPAVGDAAPVHSQVKDNLASAFAVQSSTAPLELENGPEYCETVMDGSNETDSPGDGAASVSGEGEVRGAAVRRLGKKSPHKKQFDGAGWSKGL